MKRAALLLATCLAACSLFAQPGFAPETLEKIKEVENNLDGSFIYNDAPPATIYERMAHYGVRGVSMAVIQDYKIAWAKGYGWADQAAGRRVTTETLFEPGSISKALNAVGILKLAQDRKVDLYTDINTYLTSWKFPYDSVSNGKKITLAQLLSHTAGTSVHGFPGHNVRGPVPTLLQVLDGTYPARTPPVRSVSEPGGAFQYSGGGITLSQQLLADVTGQPYEAWMQKEVLDPLGMVHSSYAQPPAPSQRPLCATGYYSDGSPVLNRFHVYPEQAAAGLWMTPTDLCRYILDMQLANKGQPSKVLTPEMVKLHLSPYNNGPTSLGMFIDDLDGAKYFQHSAGNDGFCGFYYASLDGGYGLVVFLNSEDGRLLPELINSVAKAYHWKNFYKEPQRKATGKVIAVPDSLLKTYEGIYLYDQQWAAVERGDAGYRFYANGTAVKMHFIAQDRFFNEEFPSEKEFYKNPDSEVAGYTRFIDGKKYPKAFRVVHPDTLHATKEVFADIAWHLLEQKHYAEAVVYYQRGVTLYPDDLNLAMNLAHAYLFNNDKTGALAIYKAHLRDSVSPNLSWGDQLREDLIYFKEHHFDVKAFDGVFTFLGLQKPEGY